MLRVHGGEHVLLAQQLVVVLFGLRIEARIVIRIPRECRGSRSRSRTQDRLVNPAHAAAARPNAPGVVTAISTFITPADEPDATDFHRRQHRVQTEDPEPAGHLKVRVNRHRLDLGAADQVVAHVVTNLEVFDLLGLCSMGLIFGIAVVKAQIVVIRVERLVHQVPHDFHAGIRIVRIDQWKRLAGYVSDQAAMIVCQTHLPGVLFGRVLVRRRPVDSLSRHNLQRHAVLDLVVDARG